MEHCQCLRKNEGTSALNDGKGSLIEAIGKTPLVTLGSLNENPNVRIVAKLEGNNPGGSV